VYATTVSPSKEGNRTAEAAKDRRSRLLFSLQIVVIPTPERCGGRRNLLTSSAQTTVSPSLRVLRARACPSAVEALGFHTHRQWVSGTHRCDQFCRCASACSLARDAVTDSRFRQEFRAVDEKSTLPLRRRVGLLAEVRSICVLVREGLREVGVGSRAAVRSFVQLAKFGLRRFRPDFQEGFHLFDGVFLESARMTAIPATSFFRLGEGARRSRCTLPPVCRMRPRPSKLGQAAFRSGSLPDLKPVFHQFPPSWPFPAASRGVPSVCGLYKQRNRMSVSLFSFEFDRPRADWPLQGGSI